MMGEPIQQRAEKISERQKASVTRCSGKIILEPRSLLEQGSI